MKKKKLLTAGLALGVLCSANLFTPEHKTLAATDSTVVSQPSSINLSNLTPSLVKGTIEDIFNGKYKTYNKNKSLYSTPLSINGVKYETGIGTHSQSHIRYNLNGEYTTFTVDVGVDDQVAKGKGSVKFLVIGDYGNIIHESSVKRAGDPAEQMKINVSGIKVLELVVFDADGNKDNDHANWANAKLYKATNLSDLTPNSVKGIINYDKLFVFKNKSFYGIAPISLNGVKYETGIGTHSGSEIGYDLNQQYNTFTATIGADDSVGKGNGSVKFVVKADGVVLYESPVKKSGDPAEQINVNVSGKKKLELIVLNADGSFDKDHASWANAKLLP